MKVGAESEIMKEEAKRVRQSCAEPAYKTRNSKMKSYSKLFFFTRDDYKRQNLFEMVVDAC